MRALLARQQELTSLLGQLEAQGLPSSHMALLRSFEDQVAATQSALEAENSLNRVALERAAAVDSGIADAEAEVAQAWRKALGSIGTKKMASRWLKKTGKAGGNKDAAVVEASAEPCARTAVAAVATSSAAVISAAVTKSGAVGKTSAVIGAVSDAKPAQVEPKLNNAPKSDVPARDSARVLGAPLITAAAAQSGPAPGQLPAAEIMKNSIEANERAASADSTAPKASAIDVAAKAAASVPAAPSASADAQSDPPQGQAKIDDISNSTSAVHLQAGKAEPQIVTAQNSDVVGCRKTVPESLPIDGKGVSDRSLAPKQNEAHGITKDAVIGQLPGCATAPAAHNVALPTNPLGDRLHSHQAGSSSADLLAAGTVLSAAANAGRAQQDAVPLLSLPPLELPQAHQAAAGSGSKRQDKAAKANAAGGCPESSAAGVCSVDAAGSQATAAETAAAEAGGVTNQALSDSSPLQPTSALKSKPIHSPTHSNLTNPSEPELAIPEAPTLTPRAAPSAPRRVQSLGRRMEGSPEGDLPHIEGSQGSCGPSAEPSAGGSLDAPMPYAGFVPLEMYRQTHSQLATTSEQLTSASAQLKQANKSVIAAQLLASAERAKARDALAKLTQLMGVDDKMGRLLRDRWDNMLTTASTRHNIPSDLCCLPRCCKHLCIVNPTYHNFTPRYVSVANLVFQIATTFILLLHKTFCILVVGSSPACMRGCMRLSGRSK